MHGHRHCRLLLLLQWLLWWSRSTSLQSLPTPADICTARSFCTTNATTILNSNKDSCCQSCSCDPDCFVVGNCCYDAPMPESLIEPLPCTDVNVLLNAQRNVYNPNQGARFYRIITSCPIVSLADEEIIQQCMSPKEYTFVSSMNGDRLYRNKYCASCHGEEDVVDWNVYTDCYDLVLQDFSDVDEFETFIFENCELMVHAPSYFYDKSVRCELKVVDECNVTGQWDAYNAELENACLTENPGKNDNYHRELVLGNEIYNYENIYCYLCNIKSSSEAHNDSCDSEDLTDDIRKDDGFLVMLTGLYRKQVTQDKCSNTNEIYDPYTKTCRLLICPVGQYPLNEKCRSIGNIIGVGVSIKMYVNSTSGHAGLSVDMGWIEAHPEEIVDALYRSIENTFSKCKHQGLCTLHFAIDPSGRSFFEIVARPYGNCTYFTLLYEAAMLTNGTFEFTVSTDRNDSRTVVLMADLTQRSATPWFLNTQLSTMYLSHCPARIKQVDSRMLQMCPRLHIQINKTSNQLPAAVLSSLFDARMIFNEIPTTNDSFYICLSNYTSILEETHNTGHALCPGLAISWVMLVLVLCETIT